MTTYLKKQEAAADGRGRGLADLHGDVADQPASAGANGHLLRGRSFGEVLQEFLDHAFAFALDVCNQPSVQLPTNLNLNVRHQRITEYLVPSLMIFKSNETLPYFSTTISKRAVAFKRVAP